MADEAEKDQVLSLAVSLLPAEKNWINEWF